MKTISYDKDYIFEIIHDLKAPVLSMDFALKNIKRNEFLDEIYKINKHNLNYIENMTLEYSIKKGRYELKEEITDLIKIINEEIKPLNFIIKEKNLRIIKSYDKVETTEIKSDERLIRQIILNLLTNSIKYSPDNENIKIILETKNNSIEISFENKINKELKNFSSTKIGLEIVKNKIKALKGKFKAEKTLNTVKSTVLFPL